MADYDPNLGREIEIHLKSLGLETPRVASSIGNDDLQALIESSHCKIMHGLGLDLNDDSLMDTPRRVAKMYCNEVFSGLDYNRFPKCTAVDNKMKHDELVIVKDSDVLSMCEHHFVPFVGTCSIGYIPGLSVLGLSKFPRVVDFFSRRPQIQERLTAQIHAALCYILTTSDIAVTVTCEHMCMRLRGVQQAGKQTITTKLSGRFMENQALREEFLMQTRR